LFHRALLRATWPLHEDARVPFNPSHMRKARRDLANRERKVNFFVFLIFHRHAICLLIELLDKYLDNYTRFALDSLWRQARIILMHLSWCIYFCNMRCWLAYRKIGDNYYYKASSTTCSENRPINWDETDIGFPMFISRVIWLIRQYSKQKHRYPRSNLVSFIDAVLYIAFKRNLWCRTCMYTCHREWSEYMAIHQFWVYLDHYI